MNPKVTVLMSVYNGEGFLREAIDSILAQTYRNCEFLIIDDGSTDRSRDIILSYNDQRIRLIDNEENIGLTRSLNKGLQLAKGEYIARMDADDISMPTRLEKQVEFLDIHPSIGVLGTNSLIIDEQENTLGKVNYPTCHDGIMAQILSENRFVHSSVIIRKDLLEKYGYFNEDFVMGQDYELFLRLSTVSELANLPITLHKWRRDHSARISITRRSEQLSARETIRKYFLEKHFALNKYYINLVLANYQNNPFDAILYEYLRKILRSIPSFSERLQISYRLLLSFLKYNRYLLKIRMIVKEKIKNISYGAVIAGIMLAEYKWRNHPSSIIFIMKNACNSRCIMCGLSYFDNKNITETTLKDYKIMLHNLEMNKVKEIGFSGGGDPLLCTNLISIIDYTRDICPKTKLAIYTNGIALTEDYADALIRNNFFKIVISINASTPGTYRKVMRVDEFANVVANIRRLVEVRNLYRTKTKINLSFVASKINIDDLPGLITLGAELGVDTVGMQYCRFYSRRFNVGSGDSDKVMDKKLSLFFHQDYSDNVVKKAESLAKKKKIMFDHDPLFSSQLVPKRCIWPWTTIIVSPKGEIYPCGGGEVMFYKSVRDNQLYFGNLLNEGILDFWHNEDFEKLRLSCDYRNMDKSIPQCWNCNHTCNWEGAENKHSHFIDINR